MYLNCHSYYSLRYGTMTVESLCEQAAAAGISRMALTDINNSTGIPDFVRECNSHGITPAAGIEFRIENKLLYIGVARNNQGFRELNEFLSKYNSSGETLPFPAPSFSNVYIMYPLANILKLTLKENEYIGIRPSESSKILSLSKAILVKCVILQPVTMASAEEYTVHRSLRAIANNMLLSHLLPEHTASPDEVLTPENEIARHFAMWPQIIENTRRLLDDCSITLDFRTPKNKKIYSASRYDDKLLLEKLASDGIKYRYGTGNRIAEERVRHELSVIDKLGFSSYFLIAWDIIRYSMSCGFYHVGRGSGAN